jgi:hypothetical protein
MNTYINILISNGQIINNDQVINNDQKFICIDTFLEMFEEYDSFLNFFITQYGSLDNINTYYNALSALKVNSKGYISDLDPSKTNIL